MSDTDAQFTASTTLAQVNAWADARKVTGLQLHHTFGGGKGLIAYADGDVHYVSAPTVAECFEALRRKLG